MPALSARALARASEPSLALCALRGADAERRSLQRFLEPRVVPARFPRARAKDTAGEEQAAPPYGGASPFDLAAYVESHVVRPGAAAERVPACVRAVLRARRTRGRTPRRPASRCSTPPTRVAWTAPPRTCAKNALCAGRSRPPPPTRASSRWALGSCRARCTARTGSSRWAGTFRRGRTRTAERTRRWVPLGGGLRRPTDGSRKEEHLPHFAERRQRVRAVDLHAGTHAFARGVRGARAAARDLGIDLSEMRAVTHEGCEYPDA